MAHIIEQRKTVRIERFHLGYEYNDSPGGGFGFDCDKDGNVDVENMNPAARENYEACLAGTNDTHCVGVEDFSSDYRQPATLECDCGAHVHLAHFTNECDRCHADYNMSGQKLAPRSQWGEETGESLSDILRIP